MGHLWASNDAVRRLATPNSSARFRAALGRGSLADWQNCLTLNHTLANGSSQVSDAMDHDLLGSNEIRALPAPGKIKAISRWWRDNLATL